MTQIKENDLVSFLSALSASSAANIGNEYSIKANATN